MSSLFHIKYRPDIDGLRAVAVLAVILFHGFPQYIQGGFVGVDIFFVISGYLISTIIYSELQTNSFSFLDFYSRRIKRIFPALLAVLFTTFFFGWFFLTPREYEILNQEIAGGAAFFSNFIFWRQSGYFDIAADKKPLLHLWSLAVEEQFYIFWPLILWVFSRLKVNLLYLTIFVLIASFGLNIFYINTDPIGAFYAPFTRFWELLIGGLLAYLSLYRLEHIQFGSHSRDLLSITGLACILLGVFTFNKLLPFPGWFALLPVVGATLLIFAGPDAMINRSLLSSRVMVWIGLISYPLYLWHWPVFSLGRIYSGHALTELQTTGAILLSFLLAWGTFKYIESPIRRSSKGGMWVNAMIFLMTVVGVSAYFVKENNGLASRFSVEPLRRNNQLTGCDNVVRDNVLYPCTFGKLDAKRTILIYGDSHAGHLTSALNNALGSEFKFIFLGYGGCFLSKNEGADGDKMCQLMWSQIRKLREERLYAVVHAQRWGNMDPDTLRDQMRESYKASGLAPEKIAIVGSIPNVDLDCEIANYYIPSRKKECPVYADQYLSNENFILVTKALDKPKNLLFIYPYEKLCPKASCQVISGSTANYWDDWHMSRDGALMAVTDLIDYLRN
jgi:peptidoglycan/LPS O-acetylase OafA/YrhL